MALMIGRICIFLLFFLRSGLSLSKWAVSGKCPCDFAPVEYNLTADTLCISIEDSREDVSKEGSGLSLSLSALSALYGLKSLVLKDQQPPLSYHSCGLYLRIVSADVYKAENRFSNINICPGRCNMNETVYGSHVSAPEMLLPSALVNASIVNTAMIRQYTHTLTCSLSLNQYLRGKGLPTLDTAHAVVSLTDVLLETYWRRLFECNEQKVWPSASRGHGEYQQVLKRDKARLLGNKREKKSKNRHAGYSVKSGGGTISRRKVQSVILWVGSTATLPLMRLQSQMLYGQAREGSGAVIAWLADDSMYGCRRGSTPNYMGRVGNRQYHYLPTSDVVQMGEGWACAQRRPLRALAHVLLLYDPHFLVLVDDDTLVNYPLLVHRYRKYIYPHSNTVNTLGSDRSMNTETDKAYVLGEFRGREGDWGHISRKGFFIGGSGYILNRAAIKRLVSKEVFTLDNMGLHRGDGGTTLAEGLERNVSDAFRSTYQIERLSVFADLVQHAEEYCPKVYFDAKDPQANPKQFQIGRVDTNDACLRHMVPRLRSMGGRKKAAGQYVPTGTSATEKDTQSKSYFQRRWKDIVMPMPTRLVDLCSNLMANEHTGHHSDHSMGRCLFYGAYITPVSVVCHSEVPLSTVPPSVDIGMCFGTKYCDLDMHVTCHRFRPAKDIESEETRRNTKSGDKDEMSQSLKAMITSVNVETHRYITASSHNHDNHNNHDGYVNDLALVSALSQLSKYLGGGVPDKIRKGHVSVEASYRKFTSTWDGNKTDTF